MEEQIEYKGKISPEAQCVITKNLGSFDHYLEECIENAVLQVKQSDPFITFPEGAAVEGVAMDGSGGAAAG